MSELETENSRLCKAIADLTFDKLILQEASRRLDLIGRRGREEPSGDWSAHIMRSGSPSIVRKTLETIGVPFDRVVID